MFKNTAASFMVFAFDTTNATAKTGDAANITAYVSKDYGAPTVLADTSATEMDATNAKGYYLFAAAQGETNADCLMVSAKSATANIAVIGAPAVIYTRPTTNWLAPATLNRTLVVDAAGLADANVVKLGPTGSGTAQTAKDVGGAVPAAAAGASGGLLISGSNSGTTTFGALTVTGATTLTGAVSLGSTLGVTGTTTLAAVATGAITATTIATSGNVTLNALTVTNATTLSGAVSFGSTWTVSGNVTLSGAAGLAVTNGITANITGNLSGSVGSVTGAVGSVAGAVGSVTAITTSGGIVSADVKKVNAVTVIGAGVTADLWRA